MKESSEQRLSIIENCDYITKSGKKMPGYLCQCKCGNTKVVSKNSYDSGSTRSCGCLIKEFNSGRKRFYKDGCFNEAQKYGVEESVIKKILSSYRAMLTRCGNSHHKAYKNYGGRGIKVCDEWHQSKNSFIKWALENGFEIGKSLERIDVNGNYEPENCRWATPKEQANNTRKNVHVKYNGKIYTATQLSEMFDIDRRLLVQIAKCGIELRKDIDNDLVEGRKQE